MSEEVKPAPAQNAQQQQVQIPVDVTNRETVYANFVQAHLNADEVYLELGTFSQVVTPAGPDPITLTHRVIMNFVTAKRLADLLKRAVAQHEQMFGVVELDPNRRLRVPQQQRPNGM
ncbi:DUF3467 domain-containing protein [Gemmata sp. G18]|uniref:DUF3467 domain-containing protein n=1 Tax=Gemmata palustris TaxID=2822762 RepID=A0ABS5C4Y3_9BACT|nr:DUF3467 domain-containing protein [Gemmata palustris]MBP3961076.1 DUF3467 domain-containing protein [Gemmata palustris]